MVLHHLDADWLIAVAELYHEHHANAKAAAESWLMGGDQIATSAVAWSEFLTGRKKFRPIDDAMRCEKILNAGIIDFGCTQAEKAAELFNQIGPNARKRRCDCFMRQLRLLLMRN